MNIDKIAAALEKVELAAVNAGDAPLGAVVSALANCATALNRIAKRASVPADYERVEIVQAKGPTVEMTARLLAETSFETRGREALELTLEIWETQGGALVAVSSSTLSGGSGREDARVTAVPPQDDVQAMRLAVMSAFDYHERARSMVRGLGWSIKVEVE